MSIDGFYENKYPHYGHYRERSSHNDNQYSHNSHHSYNEHGDQLKWLYILEKSKNPHPKDGALG